MVPCGLAGHRHIIVDNGGHRHIIVDNGGHIFHLHVFNLFIFVFSILFFYPFYRIAYVLLHCI